MSDKKQSGIRKWAEAIEILEADEAALEDEERARASRDRWLRKQMKRDYNRLALGVDEFADELAEHRERYR